MSVSQTAEYALRAVVWLAQNPDTPQTTHQISAGTLVSASYLPKVLQPLGRAGIVNGQRGVNGGYSLRRSPEELTVFDVVDCVDPVQRITSCPLGLQGHSGTLCPLHRMLDNAAADLQTRFKNSTIAGLLREESDAKPLCDTTPATFSITSTATTGKKAGPSA